MESMLGFDENLQNNVVEDKSQNLKLVPWMSWDEWKFVRMSLFSSSPDSVSSALKRISTWKSRGCIPVAIEVTSSIIEIQQQDPYFSNECNGCSQSEEILAMLYCMAIVRLVNGMVEKTRKKNEISIGEAADAFGIPRIVIDVRHEASHRDLPSLQLVRIAANKALDWLLWYYWEPQEKAIPTQNSHNADLRKQIKRRLCEVALALEPKQITKSSDVKEKRVRLAEHFYGHSKFMFLASHSNSTGSTKQLAKSVKKILRLYSSFSSEVVYILLEYLINALESSNYEHLDGSQVVNETENKQTAFDDWKAVVLKLSKKEPEFLVTLIEAVLEKMETGNAMDRDNIDEHETPQNTRKARQIDLLSHVLTWLVGSMKTLKLVSRREESSESKISTRQKKLPVSTILTLLHKCLLISSPVNKRLMKSALTLSHLTGNTPLLEKIKKLAPLLMEIPSLDYSIENQLFEDEDYIRRAAEDFELMKQRARVKYGKINESGGGVGRKWPVAKSWNLCPIGMLPSKIGFSGRLPLLDNVCNGKGMMVSGGCETGRGKREADMGVEEMDSRPGKKVEEGDNVMENEELGLKGCLMVDGSWRKVGEDELFAMASSVKLLI